MNSQEQLIGLINNDRLSFEEKAFHIFEHQYENSLIYSQFCDAMSRTPKNCTHYLDFPYLPISLNFTDGDGDLGLNEEDYESGIYVGDSADNFQVTVEKLENGFYVDVEGDKDARFDPLVNEQYIGPIDGVLEHAISYNHNLTEELDSGDTIRFRVFIYDRALNSSNTIVTSEVTVLE